MERTNIRVEIAVLVSMVLHLATFVCWQNRALLAHWPGFSAIAKAMRSMYPSVQRPEPKMQTVTFVDLLEQEQPLPRAAEPARTFMETTESQVTGEEPKEAQFYSDKPTVAANPENPTDKTGDTPYLKGTESRVMSVEDASPGAATAPPSPRAPEQAEPPSKASLDTSKPATSPPEPPKKIGDEGAQIVEEKKLAMVAAEIPLSVARPAIAPSPPAAPETPPAGPSGREIASVKSSLEATGVFRSGIASFNVASSPFGAYDQKIVRAVQSRWYRLIEKYGIYERAGVVHLFFELYDDGTLHSMEIRDNSAGEILALYCEKAVVDSAPFDPLPDNLRVLVGKEPREVNFTFYY